MFNVGDQVTIINDEYYSITKVGSYGKVILAEPTQVSVLFEYTPSGDPGPFTIGIKDLALKKAYSREERICTKVAAMYNRQKGRGIVHV